MKRILLVAIIFITPSFWKLRCSNQYYSVAGIDCGEAVYERLGSACPATCSNPNAPNECTLPDTEVCSCPSGKLMDGNKCIDSTECGCTDSTGLMHQVNQAASSVHFHISYISVWCLANSSIPHNSTLSSGPYAGTISLEHLCAVCPFISFDSLQSVHTGN